MIIFLCRMFIKNREDVSSPSVRRKYGMLCSIVGISLNIMLFLGKLIAGTLSRSIAITADAFNNLSDAGSSVLTMTGFIMAGKKPDKDHPFGHGRMEYLTGFFVSVAIIFMAFELFKSSFEKILHPEAVEASLLTFFVLIASILVKLYMTLYNTKIGKKIDSVSMLATATDSRNDSITTTAVLLSTLIMKFTGLKIDGFAGVIIAIFIFRSGIDAAKDTLTPLLGKSPDPELMNRINEICCSEPMVLGIHDLIVHDYGVGRLILSLHAEVPADQNILVIHDMIDNLEMRLRKELHCEASIHMDPIQIGDKTTEFYREKVESIISSHTEIQNFHDFRAVTGPTHTNLIFDIVVSPDYRGNAEELISCLQAEIAKTSDKPCHAIIHVDQAYYTT